MPCIVKSWLNISGSMSVLSACESCTRIKSASIPPTRNQKKDVTAYSVPIRLWSTVEIQLQITVFTLRTRDDARKAQRNRFATWSWMCGLHCLIAWGINECCGALYLVYPSWLLAIRVL